MPHNQAEKLSLAVAAGELNREDLMMKIRPHVK